MPLPSKMCWPTSGLVLLCGALLVPSALAQNASILPATDAALVPIPVAAAPVDATARIEMQFRDVDVAGLLSMIGEQFKVKIIVNDDVDVRLKSINLSDMTAEQALETVAEAANLQFRRNSAGVYLVAKNLAPVAGTATSVAPIVPGGIGFGSNGILPGDINSGPANTAPATGRDSSARFDADDLPDLVNATPRSSRRRTHPIEIRNIKASYMAYLIDPANHPIPDELVVSSNNKKNYVRNSLGRPALSAQDQASLRGHANSNSAAAITSPYTNPYIQRSANSRVAPDTRANAQFGGNRGGGIGNQGNQGNQGNRGGLGGAGGGAGGGGSLTLPEGVEEVVAVDPQNVLLVALNEENGEEGLRRLLDIINILDRPLRQVEIEAQFVQVTSGKVSNFGIDFTTSQGNFSANNSGFATDGNISVGFVRGNFQATLAAELSANRAKIVSAPRVTAINNLTASIVSQTSRPVVLTNTAVGIGGQVGVEQDLIFIDTQVSLTVTPTINNDDTVTVLMQPQFESQGVGTAATLGVGVVSSNQVDTVANVRDGDTIALGGLRVKNSQVSGSKIPLLSEIPLIGGLFRSRNASAVDDDLIIFLTARIIRRVGDEGAIAGADPLPQ